MTTTAAPEPIRVCGIVLREERLRDMVRHYGSSAGVRVQIYEERGGEWEGIAHADRQWSMNGRDKPAREAVVLAHAFGSTPERCAHTLEEMLQSIRAALVALPGGET